MNNKKSKLVIGIFIGLLIGLAISFLGFTAYEKFIKSDETEFENTINNDVDDDYNQVEEKELSIEDELIIKLFEIVREDYSYFVSDEMTFEDAMPIITLRQIPSSSMRNISCSDLDALTTDGNYCGENMNTEMSEVYGSSSWEKLDMEAFKKAIKKNYTISVSEDIFDAKMKEIFGKDVVYNKNDFSGGYGPVWHYNANKKVYAFYSCECGGTSASFNQSIKSAIQKGDTITMTTTIEYTDNATPTKSEIIYTFELEEETGNYIYTSRVEQ